MQLFLYNNNIIYISGPQFENPLFYEFMQKSN